MVELRLEILVVSLSTLLGRSRTDLLRDANPVVGASLIDELEEVVVLSLRPRSATMSRHLYLVAVPYKMIL